MRRPSEGRGLAAAALVLAAACGREPPPPPPGKPAVVRGVAVAVIAPVSVEDRVEVPGTVRSRTSTTISSKMVGTIVAMPVHEGSRVAAGHLLVELDDRDLAAQMRRATAAVQEAQAAAEEVARALVAAQAARTAAEAQRDLAAATLARYQQLRERRSVAPQEYDQVAAGAKAGAAAVARAGAEIEALEAKRQQTLARIEGARAELASAEVLRGYARIAAPMAGVVAAKHAEVGTTAAPGVPLLTLEDAEHFRLEAVVPEAQAAGLRPGTRVPVEVRAAEVAGPAPIVEIVPVAEPASRSVLVRLELPPSPRLATGQFGRAWFPGPRREMLAVEGAAVVRRGQLTGVYVVGADKVARFRLVTIGEARDKSVEILSGLTSGERVVVAGVERVTDGATVEGDITTR